MSDMLYKKLSVLVSVFFLETPVKNLLNSNFFLSFYFGEFSFYLALGRRIETFRSSILNPEPPSLKPHST